MMSQSHITDVFRQAVTNDTSLSSDDKNKWFARFEEIKNSKINILITGATGCGKSSTINALFNTNTAKVGQGVDPETMYIKRFELSNIVLFDSPGLGDGAEADMRHASNIIEKLHQKDADGELLIDLVLVILDGSSRDLGTSFELINKVIIPNLGKDTSRLLVAINQADMAMKGRGWNFDKNCPEPALINFLEEKVASTKQRIFESTGVETDPIYYAAGYKEGEEQQAPFNLSKLLLYIVQNIKSKKRAAILQDLNNDKTVWQDDDGKKQYKQEIETSIFESIKDGAATGAEIGEELGSFMGAGGRVIGRTAGAVVGGVIGFFSSFF
ncbi:GTPase [Pseudoalteromonas sp. SS15]|uniref:GTPase n=1 Tax=Pseudoalteromonas sp. SS15 TaxID=3139393 RepID=UPI003BA95AA5